jgi:arylsulfatase A-like enzyme
MPTRYLGLVIAVVWMPVGIALPAQCDDRPLNIVTLLADDQAEWAVGAYGNPEARTPNIDRLATQGVRFLNAFATSPVCTPSRLSFLTGLESVQVGTMNDPTSGAERIPLPYGVPSWPRVLREHGYRTAFVGKWDLGNAPEYSPLRYGLDHFFGFRAGSNYSKDPYLASGDGIHSRHQGYTDDILTDIYDTVLGMLGIPNDREGLGTGRDFSPLLRGETVQWRDAVFGQYSSDRIGNTEFVRMIRTDRWKLVISVLNPSANRFYDLEADQHELRDLYPHGPRRVFHDDGTMTLAEPEDPHADLRRELRERLRAWQESIDDPALALEELYLAHQRKMLDRWRDDE